MHPDELELKQRAYEAEKSAQCSIRELRRPTMLEDLRSERDHLLGRVSNLTNMIRQLESDPQFAARLDEFNRRRSEF